MTSEHDEKPTQSDLDDAPEGSSEKPHDKAPSLEEELGKMRNEYLYLRAEFDNFRKNSIKERSQLIRYGGEPILRELLDVVDNFERALSVEVSAETLESFRKGVAMTAHELKSLMQKFGVQEQDPIGQPFDPALHEALSSEPTDQMPAGHVSKVFRKAYLLHDKLIRPAQVVVSRELESSQKSNASGDGQSGGQQ